MSEAKFKSMRHIETVRNYLELCSHLLNLRGQAHDQSKLHSPEAEIFEEYTPKLKNLEYGTQAYKDCLKEMKPALDHHYKHNRHHPEYFDAGIDGMNLFDIIEMLCDWIASGKRMKNGDINKSIEINQVRFGYTDEFKFMLQRTAETIERCHVYHHGEES